MLVNRTLRWVLVSRLFGELYFYSTTLVAFQTDRGLTLNQVFLLESVMMAALWIFDIPSSLLADKLGHKRVLQLGRLSALLGFVLFSVSHGLWMFVAAEVLAGIAMACTTGTESTLVYGSLPTGTREASANRAFALLSTASSAGMFLGMFTGSFIGDRSPEAAVYATLAPMALSLLAVWRVPAPGRPPTGRPEHVTQAAVLLRSAVRTVREQPRLAALSLFQASAFTVANSIFWYNQLYFAEAGIPVFWFGPLMAGAIAVQFGLLLVLPFFARRFGAGWALALSCLVPGVCFLGLAWTSAAVGAILLIAGIVAFLAWSRPLVEGELNRNIADGARATTLSALGLVGALGAIALNPVVGWIGELGLSITGITLGVLLLLLGLVAPPLLRTRPSRREVPAGVPGSEAREATPDAASPGM
ncbi:hypothetical protein AN216_13720 [Streptomyces oceani]|uniref:Major facilitator superfamily (MFS) profile domain-containing protein n=1 Tax=Streptomyces oceani TaxID=1075402 RepID=A0A1E7KFE5_9ACTN|nr:hypothetical protein AN216_13720 [Streptomyces oceani]